MNHVVSASSALQASTLDDIKLARTAAQLSYAGAGTNASALVQGVPQVACV